MGAERRDKEKGWEIVTKLEGKERERERERDRGRWEKFW